MMCKWSHSERGKYPQFVFNSAAENMPKFHRNLNYDLKKDEMVRMNGQTVNMPTRKGFSFNPIGLQAQETGWG